MSAALMLPPAAARPSLDAVQDFAIDCIMQARAAGKPATILNMATGTGKTRSASLLIRRLLEEPAERVLFLVDREELADQTAHEFRAAGIAFAVEMAEWKARAAIGSLFGSVRVVIGSKDSMQRDRLLSWPADTFPTIIADEAHLSTATTWANVRGHFRPRFTLYMTATAFRTDCAPLYGRPGALVEDASVREPYPLEGLATPIPSAIAFKYPIGVAIRNGHLADVVAVPMHLGIDLKGVRTSRLTGDYNRADLESRIITHVLPLAKGFRMHMDRLGIGRAILVAPDVGSARAFAVALVAEGVSARPVHGNSKRHPMPREERRLAIKDFKGGEFRVLCSCDLVGRGFNVPEAGALLMARAYRSLVAFTQATGRITRLAPGKTKGYVIAPTWENARGLCSPLDLFLQDEPDPLVRAAAKRLESRHRGELTPSRLLSEAKLEAKREAERAQRRARDLQIEADRKDIAHRWSEWSPFSRGTATLLGIAPLARESLHVQGPGATDAEPIREGQKQLLLDYGMDGRDLDGLDAGTAGLLAERHLDREFRRLASPKQVFWLSKHSGMSLAEAAQLTAREANEVFLRITKRRRA